MILADENLYFFTYKIAYNITIDNHHDRNAISIVVITPKFNDIAIDISLVIKILVELGNIYAKLKNQYKFKCLLTFLALLSKYREDSEKRFEIEITITSGITHILTQSELVNINVQWTLENRIQGVEMKESGWNYQRIKSRKISFYKSGELNASSYDKNPLR